MDKLELSHIVGYLPYGLKVIDRFGRICEINTIHWSLDGHLRTDFNLRVESKPSRFAGENIENTKPILRRMSDLCQFELRVIINHLFSESRTIRPDLESVKYEKGYLTFYDFDTSQTYVAVKHGHEGLPVLNMSNTFNDYEVFFKAHIDINNLIDRGLAIDINTVDHGS